MKNGKRRRFRSHRRQLLVAIEREFRRVFLNPNSRVLYKIDSNFRAGSLRVIHAPILQVGLRRDEHICARYIHKTRVNRPRARYSSLTSLPGESSKYQKLKP